MNVHLGSLEIQNEAGEKRIINSSAESEAKKITLTYKQSTFSINFSALNFIAPKSIQYRIQDGKYGQGMDSDRRAQHGLFRRIASG